MSQPPPKVPAEEITSLDNILARRSDNRVRGRGGGNAKLLQLTALISTNTKTKIRLRKGIESMCWTSIVACKIVSYYLAGWTTKNKGAFHLWQ